MRIRMILFVVALAIAHKAPACDCTQPSNYGNPACRAAITAALKGGMGNANTNTTSNSLSQGQGQGQTATGGNSASNATGGAGGSGGSATGGKGGKASSSSGSTSAGGSVSGVSSASSTGAIDNASNATGGTSGVSTSETNSGNTNVAASRIPVNTAVAGFQMTTAPCRYAEGLGIQTMPAGGAVGFTFKDHDCMKMGLAQEFYSKGMNDAGDRIMCAIKEVQGVLGSDCLSILAAGHGVVATIVGAPDTYTRAQVDAIVKKVVSK